MKKNHRLFYLVLFCISITSGFMIYPGIHVQTVEGRTEEILDSNNNNLKITFEAPDSWNSGTVSQTVARLNWRLNGLTAINNDVSAFTAVVNLPSLANYALPLGQKTGLLSWLLSHYVSINGESDLTLTDGSSGHSYSISITAEQFHNLNMPIDKGWDAVLITTKQQSVTYIIAYATDSGKMGEFEDTFQNILHSIRFGSVSFSSNSDFITTGTSPAVS